MHSRCSCSSRQEGVAAWACWKTNPGCNPFQHLPSLGWMALGGGQQSTGLGGADRNVARRKAAEGQVMYWFSFGSFAERSVISVYIECNDECNAAIGETCKTCALTRSSPTKAFRLGADHKHTSPRLLLLFTNSVIAQHPEFHLQAQAAVRPLNYCGFCVAAVTAAVSQLLSPRKPPSHRLQCCMSNIRETQYQLHCRTGACMLRNFPIPRTTKCTTAAATTAQIVIGAVNCGAHGLPVSLTGHHFRGTDPIIVG